MLEIEVKLRIGRTADVESRLRALGAFVESTRSLEDDLLFDLPGKKLTKAGSLLRVRRRDDGALLTFKEKISDDIGAKVRNEVEARVSDADALETILRGLGMKRIWRYQKYRTTYRLGSLHVLIDELPIGNFVELEGSKPEIDRWAGALGFKEEEFLVDTYRDLHDAWLKEHGQAEGDMVFGGQA